MLLRLHDMLGIATLLIATAGACAADLDHKLEAGPDAGPGAPVRSEERGDGITATWIDATDHEAWIHLDLESGARVDPADPAGAERWDLAFQRFHIELSDRGADPAAVAMLPDADFDTLARAPSAMYVTDEPDQDGDGDPERVMSSGEGAWYDYDVSSHVLTPRDIVYVVRSVEGNYYKLWIQDYYDENGTPAVLSFLWGGVAPPEPAPALGSRACARPDACIEHRSLQ